MTENDGPTFCRRMRDATKAIHDTSDKLVNLKLGLSMSNDMVWANGLLVFAKVRFTNLCSYDTYSGPPERMKGASIAPAILRQSVILCMYYVACKKK